MKWPFLNFEKQQRFFKLFFVASFMQGIAYKSIADSQPGRHSNLPTTLTVESNQRLLILAPHPDDETLGAGGIAQQVLSGGGSVRSVVVTTGDAYVDAIEDYFHKTDLKRKAPEFHQYGALRLKESMAAAKVIGKGAIQLDLLGFFDGAIYPMLVKNWRRSHPARSYYTGDNHVTYEEAEDRGVAQDGQDLLDKLVKIISETKPTMVAFPDIMEDDSDHSALGFFTLLAINKYVKKDKPKDIPNLFAYLIHWKNWPPTSDGEFPVDVSQSPLYLPKNLPIRDTKRVCFELSKEEILTKRLGLEQYNTQQLAMGAYLSAFVNSTECFSQLKFENTKRIPREIKTWQKENKSFSSRPITRKNL